MKVELTSITRVKKGHLVTCLSYYNQANSCSGYSSYVEVRVYEHATRYHYEGRIIDKEDNIVSHEYSYSSTKIYDPMVVAASLIRYLTQQNNE